MKRSNSYAATVARDLSKRAKQTKEVKDILTGAQYKKVNPRYQSKPDLRQTEAHHQVLCHEPDRFHDYSREYGKA